MPQRGIVLGFYQQEQAAKSVLKALRRNYFRHSAAIRKGSNGRFSINRHGIASPIVVVTGAALGWLLGILLHLYVSPHFFNPNLIRGVSVQSVFAGLGAMCGWLAARQLEFGIDPRVLSHYRQWLVTNETVVIVSVKPADMERTLDYMRRSEEEQPVTFVFYPEHRLSAIRETTGQSQEPITSEHLTANARALAESQTVSRRIHRGRPLLKSLDESETGLKQVRAHLAETVRVEQNILLSAEWLLDNFYAIEGYVADFRRNLPRKYYEELPVIARGAQAGLPRIYGLASAFISQTDSVLGRDSIHTYLQAYQSIAPLTIGELWALPFMFRLRLIERLHFLAIRVDQRQREREQADFWANRILAATRNEPDQLLTFVNELTREQPTPSPHLADQLVGHLYDEEAALSAVKGWLERKLGGSLADAVAQEQRTQAIEQIALGNAITSMRTLSQLDWRELFESTSRVDAILWTDPAGIYPCMDFETRDRYRHTIEEVSRRSPVSELDIAMKTLQLADEAPAGIQAHVGYFLIDEGRETLERAVGSRPGPGLRLRRLVWRYPMASYGGGIFLLTAAIFAACLHSAMTSHTNRFVGVLLSVLALLPASELAIQTVNYFVTRFLPPRVLPKMSYEQGIPEAYRTLVVVPMMLLTPESIRDEAQRLEIRYLANPDDNLRFALLSDFSDAVQERMPDDAERLEIAVQNIEHLNTRYGAGRFFLFHRERGWSETEGKWIGWERKRGKLEQLNRYLMGEIDPELDRMLRVGDAESLRGIRFVITLDADTQLPRDTARRMVETLAHPLNEPQLAADERSVMRGYTLLQPRVSTSLPSATGTYFSRLFTDPSGTDPYTHAVSDVYQDLTGEGSYHGKGIYDLAAFHKVLSSRLPQNHILSHDLLEGSHVRVGLVSDIELFDLFPQDYVTYASRQHRWIRGDWQIMDWLLPTVPSGNGGRVRNPLSVLNRWKITDNLRRSLLPATLIALLAVAWLCSDAPVFFSWFAALILFSPPLIDLLNRLTSRFQSDPRIWKGVVDSFVRSAISTSLLPHQAGLSVDAIMRVWYRRLMSHRQLLEWETAQESHRKAKNRQEQFLRSILWIPIGAISFACALTWISANAEMPAAPFITLWTIAPLLVAWLNTSARRPIARGITNSDRHMLRHLARQTWRFFDQFVGPSTNWLPPDNYQTDLRVEVAERTSPTNVGIWLLAAIAANDFGYLTMDDVIERTSATMETLGRLQLHEGHLLNWYNTATCEPLQPPYVSMVDSGNLLGHLWTFQQAIQELLDAPVLGPQSLRGLADTLGLYKLIPPPSKAQSAKTLPILKQLDAMFVEPTSSLEALVRRLREVRAPAQELSDMTRSDPTVAPDQVYWAEQVELQLTRWNTVIDRYLPWLEVLIDIPQEGLLSLGTEAHEWRRQALASLPSLRTIASGHVPGLAPLAAVHAHADVLNLSDAVRSWLDRLEEVTSQSRWFAGERLGQGEAVLAKAHTLADGMNMKFLYDPERRLFAVGYNVNDRRRDNFYYDMLASEARLGSFVAIARGEVPVEHWFALSRPFAEVSGQRALLSWSGTMFEYLMPLLVTRAFENSLLEHACSAAVACQIAYGRKRGIPWGISEAAFSALDARQIYQYRAFGVPGLGMKRGLEEDLVVAPYATALSLGVDPAASVQNLRRLTKSTKNGLRGPYGFYESIDYTRHGDAQGDLGVVVHTFMAHHQGMSLLAINNVLNANIMQTRFHSDPRVRSTESLLYERMPLGIAMTTDYAAKAPLPRLTAAIPAASVSRVETPDTPVPRTHLLSNQDYCVMVTNSGGGFSTWKDKEISRWRADTTRDSWGSFCYLKDLDTGGIWSTTYHPVGLIPRNYTVLFAPEKAEFRRNDNGIETVTEVIVSPEDNTEIRRVTLINQTSRIRRIELTSYVEIALAPHNADKAHPAFSKLFVQTEALPDQDALLASRRPRSANDPTPWAVHTVSCDAGGKEPFQYETDRARFLGRGRGTRSPKALEENLSNTVGPVLDPIFSIRKRVTLEPGERLQIAFTTGAGDSREAVVALAEKYCDIAAVRRAMELAWTHAQIDLRHLRIQPEEAMRFQQLASYVLYPNSALRPPEDRLRRNTLGQSRLWAHGISGDLPIVLVTVGSADDLDVVRQIMMAHSYWRVRGLKVDLVIINEEASSYDQPLHNQLRRFAQAYAQDAGTDQPGGVFLRPKGQIPEDEMTLLLTVARVVLIAARGNLTQQLGALSQLRALPGPFIRITRIPEEPSSALPFMDLKYFNGIGGFTATGKEYAIYLGPGTQTPAPWINVMANPGFGTLISESGRGFSWYGNSQSNRLTPWSNDPITDVATDAIYIRDDELGVLWNPTASPIRELDAYRAIHGQGYSVFEHNSHALEQEMVTFVPMDAKGGAPLRIQRLRIRNRSTRRRKLTITSFLEWTLGVDREDTQMHVATTWDTESQTLLARNPYHPDFGSRIAFAACTPNPDSFTGDRAEFLGRNGSPTAPAAMRRVRLSNRVGAGLDPCAALQVAVEIEPGQQVELIFLLGEADDIATVRSLVQRFKDGARVNAALEATKAWWDRTLETVQIDVPDLAVNFLINRWLLYQDLSCRIWGRSAFYQSGGAYGFRDQLQDVMALLHTDSAVAREQILRSASRQFMEGDVQHWWHPPSGAGVRTRISDDLLWLPFVTAQYVRVTGDRTILDEMVSFLDGPVLKENEHETMFTPHESSECATLLEHCRRTIHKGLTAGPHGLPLMGTGDWNDGLNRVGAEGQGESVWLAWFLIHVLHDFSEMLRLHGDIDEAQTMDAKAADLAHVVEEQAWDGAWYRRAYFDDGTPLGSAESAECRIDSLAQSWAVISGAGDPNRAAQAMQAVEEQLVKRSPGMVLLFTPPFDKTEKDPGYIKGYLPGVRENGGQYTHGSLWTPLAFARMGEGDKAVDILRLMNPIEHTRTPEDVLRYKVEPYVLPGDVYALKGQEGRGGWTWYSGSAGWMYRIWLEEVLGFERRADTLKIDPRIQSSWDGFTIRYRYQNTPYEIKVENPDHVSQGVRRVDLDGKTLSEPCISLSDDGVPHKIRVVMGAPLDIMVSVASS